MSKRPEDARTDQEIFDAARPYHIPHSGPCGDECEGQARFGVKGGNVIRSIAISPLITPGRRTLWTFFRHAFAGFKHRIGPAKRTDIIGQCFSQTCSICGYEVLWPPGSVGYDMFEACERFRKFTDTRGEPLWEGAPPADPMCGKRQQVPGKPIGCVLVCIRDPGHDGECFPEEEQ